jgi:hypothetical protein
MRPWDDGVMENGWQAVDILRTGARLRQRGGIRAAVPGQAPVPHDRYPAGSDSSEVRPPAFWTTTCVATRHAFGLPAHRPLTLVVAGSWGVGDVAGRPAMTLAEGVIKDRIQEIVAAIKGRNVGVLQRLDGRPLWLVTVASAGQRPVMDVYLCRELTDLSLPDHRSSEWRE